MRLEDYYNTKEILNYFKERETTPLFGESLFPSDKIEAFDYDVILGSGGLPVSASVHALDTETQMASRDAIERGYGDLAFIKRQIKISEKDLQIIKTPRTNTEFDKAIAAIYDDAEKMRAAVETRVEAMRMELISSGKLKIEENGVKVTVDYKLPSGNVKTFDWSIPASKPLDDIEELATAVEEQSGSRPTRMLTSRKIQKVLCANESVRKAIHGLDSDKTVTLGQLNGLLAEQELPVLVTYEAKYRVETAKGYKTVRFFPVDKISMFGDETPGDTLYGLTPEELELIGDNTMETASMVGNIFVGSYKTPDPVATFTKACATAMPTLPRGEELGIATVKM
ncbi:major capsid protein [Metaclostridioides mangenotii]|uniref:major capsid protein n=1 Tax=Metaclostridioides mangenotii TaxID=1540 RepID=UPI0028EC9948|nr:major capsid protein [Clostridioides mangenotii]